MEAQVVGMSAKPQDVENGAVEQLEDALEAEDPVEKDFHVRQALQLLGVASTDA